MVLSGNNAIPCFSTAVIKIASRCNLDCSYCYVYNAGDQSYRERPALMSSSTLEAIIERVQRHAADHDLRSFTFCFHGGEPLLAPRSLIHDFVAHAREVLEPRLKTRFVLQTNGVLLDAEWCRLLRRLDVRVGVSIDGPRAVHDRWRIDKKGNGSYEAVLRGWRCAIGEGLEPSILAVIDPSTDPLEIHDHLAALGPRRVDLLLPAATHDRPPQRAHEHATPHGDWLLRFFERWTAMEPSFRVRIYDTILAGIFGLGRGTDDLGSGDNGIVVIETDGAIEPVDVLRACRPGLTRTDLSIHTHDLDRAFDLPLVREYYFSHQRLPEQCRACSVRSVCGGGYLSHRFSTEAAFDNPSVYCLDLLRVISGLQRYVVGSLPDELREATGLVPLDFDREVSTHTRSERSINHERTT